METLTGPALSIVEAYFEQEISAHDLSALLDAHLHELFQLHATTGEAITQEQASAYHHIRRLRDLLQELSAQEHVTRNTSTRNAL